MKINMRLLFVGAIAAVAVLAVPTLASAAVWKHGGSNVKSDISLSLLGGELFETSEKDGMSCEIKATLTTEGGSTGEITTFDTLKCPVGFGVFEKCELNTSSAVGLPWTVHVNATDLTVTGWRTKRTFKGTGCSVGEQDRNLGSVTLTLDTAAAISDISWLDSITGYTSGGTLTVQGANKGTYGIG